MECTSQKCLAWWRAEKLNTAETREFFIPQVESGRKPFGLQQIFILLVFSLCDILEVKTISEDDIKMFPTASIVHIKQLFKNPAWLLIITIDLEAM